MRSMQLGVITLCLTSYPAFPGEPPRQPIIEFVNQHYPQGQGYRTINALDFACFLVFYLKSQATIGFDRQNSRFSRENIVR